MVHHANIEKYKWEELMGRKFKNITEQYEYEYIQELKNNNEKAFAVKNNNYTSYMLILHRGEQLFYQEGTRAFICEISARYDFVITESIKRWDTGEKITEEEKENIRENITKFFKDNYNTSVKFT